MFGSVGGGQEITTTVVRFFLPRKFARELGRWCCLFSLFLCSFGVLPYENEPTEEFPHTYKKHNGFSLFEFLSLKKQKTTSKHPQTPPGKKKWQPAPHRLHLGTLRSIGAQDQVHFHARAACPSEFESSQQKVMEKVMEKGGRRRRRRVVFSAKKKIMFCFWGKVYDGFGSRCMLENLLVVVIAHLMGSEGCLGFL